MHLKLLIKQILFELVINKFKLIKVKDLKGRRAVNRQIWAIRYKNNPGNDLEKNTNTRKMCRRIASVMKYPTIRLDTG